MKTLQKILIATLIVLATLTIISFLLPSIWHVERSITIDADPEDIHIYVEDLSKWPSWTAWNQEADPTISYIYEGPKTGAGAVSKWSGQKMGNGSMTITKSDPETGVWYDLKLEENGLPTTGSVTYQMVDDGTLVTWMGTGELGNNPINRYFGILIESMVGADLDKGLAKLKKTVEEGAGGGAGELD